MLNLVLIGVALAAGAWGVLVLASNDRGDISYWPIAAPAFLLAAVLLGIAYARHNRD
jgi:hypothetical protein